MNVYFRFQRHCFEMVGKQWFKNVRMTVTVIHQLSANAHQFSAENAINLAQDFYRVQKPCSSIERKYFGQLPVDLPLAQGCTREEFFDNIMHRHGRRLL